MVQGFLQLLLEGVELVGQLLNHFIVLVQDLGFLHFVLLERGRPLLYKIISSPSEISQELRELL